MEDSERLSERARSSSLSVDYVSQYRTRLFLMVLIILVIISHARGDFEIQKYGEIMTHGQA